MRGRRLPSVAAGATAQNSGTFVSGRGNAVKIDVISEQNIPQPGAFTTVTVGGQNIVENVPVRYFLWDNFRGQFRRIVANFKENQTFQIFVSNGAITPVQLNFIEYYENRYNAQQFRDNLNSALMRTKRVHFGLDVAAGADAKESFVAPKNRGKIFAIQVFCDGPTPGIGAGLVTVAVNGTNVIENVTALNFAGSSSRENLYPIDIEPGSTLEISLTNSASAALLQCDVALYFVPDEKC